MLVGKKRPAIFIFDLKKNKIDQVVGIPENLFPCYPCFDQSGEGVAFHAIDMPNKKLGTIYCLNRPTSIYHVASPQFDKAKFDSSAENYLTRVNPEGEYMAMQPSFSKDFT